MVYCSHCQCDVNPVKVMRATKDSLGEGGAINGFVNVCPNKDCELPLPPDEPLDPPADATPKATAKPAVARSTGDPVEDLKAAITALQERQIALNGEAQRVKNEQADVKRKLRGLQAMLNTYERATRTVA